MTRDDILSCVHEPFGDAFYFGPERLSIRYEKDEAARQESGFSQSTFKTIFERIEREGKEVRDARFLFCNAFTFTFCSLLWPVISLSTHRK